MRDNFQNFNEEYNKLVAIFVEQMLSPERVGKSGYIPIGRYQKTETIFSAFPDIITDEIQNDLLASEELSEWEKVVLSNLIFGEKTNFVLAGAMGSGKTALVNFLITFLKTITPHMVYSVSLNFHEGFPADASLEDTIVLFKDILSKQISNTLNDIIVKDHLIDKLIVLWNANSKIYFYNNGFLKETRKENWNGLLEQQKIDKLFEYLDKQNSLIEGKLYSLFELLKSVKILLEQSNKKIILFFDNIDRLLPAAQLKILDDILAKNEISQIKSLIAMRRSGYRRFSRNADFDYGYFHHTGPFTIRVLKKRLEYWKESIDEHKLTRNLDDKFKLALKSRINFILEDIDKSQNSYTKKFLHSLSGRSVRVGLDLSQRIFINNVFPFNEPSIYDNHIAKSLLLGENKIISPHDPLVVNLFQLPDFNVLSILQIRILQLIMEFNRKPHLLKFRNIIKVLNKIGYTDDDEIRSCINKLLDRQRPLFWLDTYANFESFDELYMCDEVIHISEIGHSYYKYLLVDLNYIQDCFTSVDWSDDNIPVDYENNLYERFSYLRQCLLKIHDVDYQQIKKYVYLNNVNGVNNEIENLELFSSRIMYHIVKRFLNITRGHKLSTREKEYLLDWKSTLTICQNNSIADKCKQGMEKVIKILDKRISGITPHNSGS